MESAMNSATAEYEQTGSGQSAATRWILASLSLSILLSSLGTSIANVGLPTLAQAFNASFQQVQWVVLAYLLAVTTLVVGVGRLGDLIGRRRLLIAGIALFILASALSAAAPSLRVLVAARAVQGLGAAAMMALAMAFVGDTVPKARTASAMGLLGAMSAIGTALGPSLGGLLIAGPGWRMIFLVNVPLGLIALLLAYRHLPADKATAERPRFDIAGTALLAVTLAAYALSMTLGRGQFGLLNLGLMVAAGIGVALFLRVETRAAAPLVRLSLLREPAFGASLAMSGLVSTVMMATLVVGPFYLSRGLGLDAALVGLTLSAGPVVTALTSIPAGRIADRFGARRMTIAGLAGMAMGTLALALMPLAAGVAGYVVPIIVTTTGYALFQTANNTAVMADVSADRRGVVSGMLNLARNLGLVTGAAVMGAVFAFASATSGAAEISATAAASGMRATFGAALVLVVAALAMAMAVSADRARR